jgi:dihydrofolate reductase
MTIRMIWAEATDRVIGAFNGIPWAGKVPGEMQIFKDRTMGAAVVMGRTTWDSLMFRPLPGRRNIVLTRNLHWSAVGAEPMHSMDEVAAKVEDFWVIGGGAVYAEYLPLADHIVRTRIALDVDGDTYAPELDDADWQVTDSAEYEASTGVTYIVEDIVRRGPA